MKSIRSLIIAFTLLVGPLPLSTIAQEVTGHLSTLEENIIAQNPDLIYVELSKEQNNIAAIVSQLSDLDENSNSPLQELNEHIKKGFSIAEYDAVINTLEYAESFLQKHLTKLDSSYVEKITTDLNEIIDNISNGSLTRGLRNLVINENIDVLGKSTFEKHIKTKQGISISGKLKVSKTATFNSNVIINGPLTVPDVTIGSISVADISVNGTLSVNDEIINNNFQITSFSSPGVLHNDSAGSISTSLVVDADITNNTISNAKLATISSADIPGYIVVRDNLGNFATNMITLDGTVTNPTDATTKAYVDTAISLGLVVKSPALVVSTANVLLSGLQTIDSVALTTNDRVLLINQTNEVENGLWLAQAGAWIRPADFANGSAADLAYVLITSGAIHAGSSYVCSTPTAIIGTDPIDFALFSLPSATTAANVGTGTGLVFKDKTGVTLNFRSLLAGDHLTITNNTNDIAFTTDATSANTASTIVARDASGNFNAATISIADEIINNSLTITPFNMAGIVHNNASGLLSSSLIVNADVDPSAAIVDTKLATISRRWQSG